MHSRESSPVLLENSKGRQGFSRKLGPREKGLSATPSRIVARAAAVFGPGRLTARAEGPSTSRSTAGVEETLPPTQLAADAEGPTERGRKGALRSADSHGRRRPSPSGQDRPDPLGLPRSRPRPGSPAWRPPCRALSSEGPDSRNVRREAPVYPARESSHCVTPRASEPCLPAEADPQNESPPEP